MYTEPQLKLIESLFEQKAVPEPLRRQIYATIARAEVKPTPHVREIINGLMAMPDHGAPPAAAANEDAAATVATTHSTPLGHGLTSHDKTDHVLRTLGINRGRYAIPKAEVPMALLHAMHPTHDHLILKVDEWNSTRYIRVLLTDPDNSRRLKAHKLTTRSFEHMAAGALSTATSRYSNTYRSLMA